MARAVPLHRTCDAEINPDPFTVRLNAVDPATTLEGDKDAREGAGLGAGLSVKLCAAEVPPPGAGVSTVTLATPAAPRSEAGTWACRLVLD